MRNLKLRPAKSDYGPQFKWEGPVWEWFRRLAQPPPMGGPPTVNGADFLAICLRERWNVDLAFQLLDRILGAYAEHAETEKP